MAIFKKKYYILESTPGISGFKRWGEKEYRVSTGFKATNHKSYIVKEFKANGNGSFRIEDGHVPEYQPIASENEIFNWLDNNPYQTVFILNPEVYGL